MAASLASARVSGVPAGRVTGSASVASRCGRGGAEAGVERGDPQRPRRLAQQCVERGAEASRHMEASTSPASKAQPPKESPRRTRTYWLRYVVFPPASRVPWCTQNTLVATRSAGRGPCSARQDGGQEFLGVLHRCPPVRGVSWVMRKRKVSTPSCQSWRWSIRRLSPWSEACWTRARRSAVLEAMT